MSRGCASVDFAVNGEEADPHHGFRIAGDFLCGDDAHLSGVFVFTCAEQLAGVEIYQLTGEIRSELPFPDELRPFDASARTRRE